MKKRILAIALLMSFGSSLSFAQNLVKNSGNYKLKDLSSDFNALLNSKSSDSRAACDNHFNSFTYYKHALAGGNFSNFQAVPIHNNEATLAGKLAQKFEAPQDIEISDVFFMAFAGINDTIDANVSIQSVDAGGLPGTVLASAVVSVAEYGFYSVTFATPLTVSDDYFIVIDNPENDTLSVINTIDESGLGEDLAAVFYMGAWAKYSNASWDFDLLVFPMTAFSANGSFTMNSDNVNTGETVVCTNTSDPIFYSRMYNAYAAYDYYTTTEDSSFYWNIDGTGKDYQENKSITPSSAGTVSVEFTAQIGLWSGDLCTDVISKPITVISGTGINDQAIDNKTAIYPNPSSGIINIKSPENSVVVIYNAIGSVIKEVSTSFNTSLAIDLTNEPDGIYFIKVATNDETVVKKINLIK